MVDVKPRPFHPRVRTPVPIEKEVRWNLGEKVSLRLVLYLMTEEQPPSDTLFKQEREDKKSNSRHVVLDACLLYKAFYFTDGKCYNITTNKTVTLLGVLVRTHPGSWTTHFIWLYWKGV